jgi:LacI family transcriptional regulator, galactose operon repressor
MRPSPGLEEAATAPATRKPPTILDVAAEAGVSKSTVSNVVRGVAEIAPETRTRVLQAIERLRYRPSGIARQFVQQRSTMLGVLLDDLSNPNNAQMAQGVERAAFGSGYTTMFCNIEGSVEGAMSGVEVLLSQRVAGIIMLAFIERGSPAFDALHEVGLPTVFVGLSGTWGDSVGPRDAQGARLVSGHLLDLGHERIAYVRTPLVERSGDQARTSGYRDAMRRRGLRPMPTFVWTPGSRSVRISNRHVSFELAMTSPKAPTACFVSNDVGAIGLIDACEAIGLRVPADVSVAGFDDIAIAGLKRIALTTVSQPLMFQAERAVDLLLERIERPTIAPRHVRVPVELRVRESTAPPSRARSNAGTARRAGGPGAV